MPPNDGRVKWDPGTHLKNVDDVTAYLEASIDEPTSDANLLRTVIHDAVLALRRLARERDAGGKAG